MSNYKSIKIAYFAVKYPIVILSKLKKVQNTLLYQHILDFAFLLVPKIGMATTYFDTFYLVLFNHNSSHFTHDFGHFF